MILATSIPDGPPITFNVAVRGLAVYLDNWALIDLAERIPDLGKRFVKALHASGDLLFSVTNAAELSGSQGPSAQVMRTFLDEIGPYWFPVELDPMAVVKREEALQKDQPGANSFSCCVCSRFVKDYFADRFVDFLPNSGKVIGLSQDGLTLGPVLDWVGPQHSSIKQGSANFDAALIELINEYRAKFEQDASWLDTRFPILSFRPDMPATFAYLSLMRTLILEAKSYQLKKGDGLDFCHAIVSSAYASAATLDKHWKRRVESLPTPNGLARIYSDLDKLVIDMDTWVKQSRSV